MRYKDFRTPRLDAILAEFMGPLFDHATVKLEEETLPDGSTLPKPETAKILIENLSAKEAEGVGKKATVTIKHEYEDQKALIQQYEFTFLLEDISFEPIQNGMVRPRFKQTLKEYKHV